MSEPNKADRDTVQFLVGHPSEFRAEILADYRLKSVREALLQAAKDTCMYCGGRAPAEPAHGPNSAGNWTHIGRHSTEHLCAASAIHLRIRALTAPAPSVGEVK